MNFPKAPTSTLVSVLLLGVLSGCSLSATDDTPTVGEASAKPETAEPTPACAPEWTFAPAKDGCEVGFVTNAPNVAAFRWVACAGMPEGQCEALAYPEGQRKGAAVAVRHANLLSPPVGSDGSPQVMLKPHPERGDTTSYLIDAQGHWLDAARTRPNGAQSTCGKLSFFLGNGATSAIYNHGSEDSNKPSGGEGMWHRFGSNQVVVADLAGWQQAPLYSHGVEGVTVGKSHWILSRADGQVWRFDAEAGGAASRATVFDEHNVHVSGLRSFGDAALIVGYSEAGFGSKYQRYGLLQDDEFAQPSELYSSSPGSFGPQGERISRLAFAGGWVSWVSTGTGSMSASNIPTSWRVMSQRWNGKERVGQIETLAAATSGGSDSLFGMVAGETHVAWVRDYPVTGQERALEMGVRQLESGKRGVMPIMGSVRIHPFGIHAGYVWAITSSVEHPSQLTRWRIPELSSPGADK